MKENKFKKVKRKFNYLITTPFRNKKNKKNLLEAIKQKKEIKLILGSADIPTEKGWYATDKGFLDICKEKDWEKLFKNKNSVKKILAEHVFEHITLNKVKIALKNIYSFLNSEGRIRIAVPDGFNPSKEYIEYVKVKGKGPGAKDHKILYTFRGLKKILKEAKFEVKPVEWFDKKGQFHKINWDEKDDKITRSSKFGVPNKTFAPSHLSLIVDGVKK